MNPIEWLCDKAPGFRDLSEEERTAISNFSLLWSFFEAKALDNNASANRILAIGHEWESTGLLNISPFAPILDYFCDRYFRRGIETEYFSGLSLRSHDEPSLVRAVLKRENTNPGDCVSVLLIVVWRLRNNLFHGLKWAYGIKGQLDNFRNANAALMAALEMQGV